MSVLLKTNIKNSSFKIEDAQKAISLKKINTPNYRYVMHRLAGFSPEEYNDMEYDFAEHARIIDTEAYVSSSFRKKRQLILKNGYQIKSKNTRNLEYIKKRLYDIEYVTSQSFRDFLVEVIENMVNFNNVFILKYRKEDLSIGNVTESPTGAEIKPIAGLYVLATPTIDTATNPKTGQIKRYRHRVTENYSKQFKPNDIYHFFENKRVGLTVGTPPAEAVKDDIILLRSIEQDAESLIHRHSNPFMLVQVGSDKSPARMLGDGVSEIDVYASLIDNVEEEGGAAVPHRVDVKYLGAESQALRLETYLAYFKQRVLSGLCISEVDLGLSSGGASSDLASESLKDDVRTYQSTIENYITNYIFTELLLESPMYKNKQWVPYEDRVNLTFTEADLDKRIKIESHYLNLYQSQLITKEAAIRRMEFDEEDLNPIVIPQNDNSNSVKSTIKNNILAPKNQHNLKIQDHLTVTHYKSLMNYYSKDFDVFISNLLEHFPTEVVYANENKLKKVYEQLDCILVEYGLEYVNAFVEETMFSLLA